MRKITLEEEHTILLEMAKAFHKICTENNIPYFMLGGTMLGAVRHKGFIPWDDDMDFGIPREHYARFTQIANEQLPPRYKFLTTNNSDYAVLGIGKLEDTRTYFPEIYSVNTDEKLGVNIDIFPLDYTDERIGFLSTNWIVRMIFKFQKLLFVDASNRSLSKRVLANFCQAIFRFKKDTLINYTNSLMLNHKSNQKMVANLYGAWGMKEVVPTSIFGEPHLYTFEDTKFYGPDNADQYLKHLYNNYMQLPPEEQRHIHATEMYIYD